MNSRSAVAQATRPAFRTFTTILIAAFVLAALPAFAAIEGTVTNATTNKPSKGDQVVLLELAQGMNEVATTKTDASGHFKFDVQSAGSGPHLVRVNHQDVNYFRMVPPGMNSGDVTVYDASKKVGPLSYSVETAFQGSSGNLQVVQFYIVHNQSQPPRTQTAETPLEIVIPQNAKIDSTDVQPPGGQPIQTSANPNGRGRYTFDYPMRPGDTTFRIMYNLPYTGEFAFNQSLPYPVQQYAVITPQSIGFKANSANLFRSQPHQGGVNVQIASNLPPNADVSFRVSGTGQMPDNTGASDQGGGGMGGDSQAAQGGSGRPGGGLGAPIDSPDPLTKYRWPLLFGFAVLLVFGAFYMVTHRQPPTAQADSVEGEDEVVPIAQPRSTAPQGRSSPLLEAMKEELFQLEVDRALGHITPDEYARTKEAYDATLKRALSRQTREAAS